MVIENEMLNAIKFFSLEKENGLVSELANGGRWSMDYTALRHLQYIMQSAYSNKINNILEFCSGVSTILLKRYVGYNGKLMTTYEHDAEFAKYMGIQSEGEFQLKISPLQEYVYNGCKTLTFKDNCKELKDSSCKFELIVIDAPFGQPNYSRPQILFLLPQVIDKDNFILFFDDTEREGEKQTMGEVCRILVSNGIRYKIESYKGEKEHTIICDTNKEYLLSSI